MDDTRIARVYAEALFEAATEAGAVEPVRRDLGAFIDALTDSRELRSFFLLDEDMSADDKRRVVMDLTEGGDARFRNFLKLVVDKGREPVVEEVGRIYNDLVERAAGVLKVELTTAMPLPDAVGDELKESLETSLGKIVQITYKVDDSIIGGVRLRVGDRVADASLRHKFEQLRSRLVKSTARVEVSVEAAS